MRLLIVEDDALVHGWLRRVLGEDGLDVDVAPTAQEGRQLGTVIDYALALVDLGLPDRGGITLVRELRRAGRTMPIIILSGRGSDDEIVAGLDAGADDYLVKPVAGKVLRARVRAALRRGGATRTDQLRVGELVMDRAGRSVHVGTRELELRPREYALLEQLMLEAGTVVRRTELLERVWGLTFDPRTNVLDATMSRLRARLAREGVTTPRLETVRGVGFVLTTG